MNAASTDMIRKTLSGTVLLAVYVCGSTAAGRNRMDCDVDIAILPTAPLQPLQLMALRNALSEQLMRDVDLVDLSRATTVLRKEVVLHGRLLLESDPRRRAEFEMYTLSDYARLNEERAPVLAALGQPLPRHA
jgi:predicted nucleotidyltransferase